MKVVFTLLLTTLAFRDAFLLSTNRQFSQSTSTCTSLSESSDGRSLRDRRRNRRSQSRVELKQPLKPKEVENLVPIAKDDAVPLDGSIQYPIEESIRHAHVNFYGFDELFPQSNLGELFDTNGAFRSDIRQATRIDFASKDSSIPKSSFSAINNPRSSVMASWRKIISFPTLSEVFEKYSVSHVTAPEFISKLVALCGTGENIFGSWIDIVGVGGKRIPHSWHQDSGLDQITVMVGFPPEDRYVGAGVFSHVAPLRHRLPEPEAGRCQPRLWEGPDIGEDSILRPSYRRGKEVMVYNDRDCFHSAPDITFRESIWRFM